MTTSTLTKTCLFAFSLSLLGRSALASSKEECVDAHGKGQDQRDRGQLAKARQSFLVCAQSTCPALIQGDCARFNEELAHLVPTVTFGARDANASDIPNTSVYVDDTLMAMRLDEGKSYEMDPGKHVIRYLHDGRETTLKVVLNQGEKGRLILATFPQEKEVVQRAVTPPPPVIVKAPPTEKKSAVPLVLSGVGAAALVTGGVLFGIGLHNVPSNCSITQHDCTGPQNDPSLDRAHSAMRMANWGTAVGVSGAVLLVSGLVWHFVQPTKESKEIAWKPYLEF